jgi:hypothetical protein
VKDGDEIAQQKVKVSTQIAARSVDYANRIRGAA